MNRYPFNSTLRDELLEHTEGVDYAIWKQDDFKDKVENIKLPIIEIGGPTEDGYVFLDEVSLFSEPIITNISDNPLPIAENANELKKYVKQQIDGTSMPYKDRSIGIFLMQFMSHSSDWWVELSDEEKEKATPQYIKESTIASLEMGQVAAGLRDINDVHYSQRILIYKEVKRCLCKGGLFFTNGNIEELVILQNFGFNLIAYLQIYEGSDTSYEFVVEKED